MLHKGGLIFESDIQDIKTSLFKVQVAFTEEYNQSKFDVLYINIRNYKQSGSVANLIITQIRRLNPLILDILPLTLEEVFTYEMEVYGYSYNDVLEGIENEK